MNIWQPCCSHKNPNIFFILNDDVFWNTIPITLIHMILIFPLPSWLQGSYNSLIVLLIFNCYLNLIFWGSKSGIAKCHDQGCFWTRLYLDRRMVLTKEGYFPIFPVIFSSKSSSINHLPFSPHIFPLTCDNVKEQKNPELSLRFCSPITTIKA